jgi:hypothetical protein
MKYLTQPFLVVNLLASVMVMTMDYTPYTTGSQRDEYGKNFYHVLASNCDRPGGVLQALGDFERTVGHDTQRFMTTWSIGQKDNDGKTPMDIVTDMVDRGQGCSECAQLMDFFEFVDKNTGNDGIFRLKRVMKKVDDEQGEDSGKEFGDSGGERAFIEVLKACLVATNSK